MKKFLSLLLALCLMATLLPMAVFAEEAADKYITVRFDNNGTRQWNEKYTAGTLKYGIAQEDGVIANGTADNWNIKLEYPEGGDPVLTLKGAHIKPGDIDDFPLMISGNADLTIKVEEDSSIPVGTRTALYIAVSSTVTITGPGKLTIAAVEGADGSCITFGSTKSFDAGKLVIKDANLELKPHATSTTRYAIGFTNEQGLVIDNSKINIVTGEKCMGISGLALVTSDADGKVTKVATYWTSKGADIERPLTIQNGSVVTGSNTSREFLAATGTITIKDSTIEADAGTASGNKVFNKKPALEGEYTAVGAAKAEGAKVEYNPSKATTYKYVKIVPGKVDLGELGVVTEPTTEPTTQPTTEPTTEPTTAPTTEPTTEPTTAPTTEPTGEATKPGTDDTTKPDATEPGDTTGEEGGMSAATLAILVCTAVIVLGVGAFALLALVIKPKWLMNLLKK